jgi:hypothetical protein
MCRKNAFVWTESTISSRARHAALAERLAGFEIIVAMREWTLFGAPLLRWPGSRNATV